MYALVLNWELCKEQAEVPAVVIGRYNNLNLNSTYGSRNTNTLPSLRQLYLEALQGQNNFPPPPKCDKVRGICT